MKRKMCWVMRAGSEGKKGGTSRETTERMNSINRSTAYLYRKTRLRREDVKTPLRGNQFEAVKGELYQN